MNVDDELRRRLAARCERGLVQAAERLAGDEPAAVCHTFARWRDSGERELPWLAGPALTALGTVGVTSRTSAALRTLKRFLVGAETDSAAVLDAVDRCAAEAGPEGPPLPPDARGALVDAADRFFDLLAEAYGAVHAAVRGGRREAIDDVVAEWQPRLDSAGDDIDDRAGVFVGRQTAGRARPVSDHPGLAMAFVAAALVIAGVVVWLVLNGWPAEPARLRP